MCKSFYYLISTLIVYSNLTEIRVNLVNLVQTALLIAVLMKKFQLALYIVQYANFQLMVRNECDFGAEYKVE